MAYMYAIVFFNLIDSLLERFAEKVSSVLSTAQAQEDNEGSSIPVKMSIVSSSGTYTYVHCTCTGHFQDRLYIVHVYTYSLFQKGSICTTECMSNFFFAIKI